ncbi:hypothetical protein BOTBODRAFT_621709 [Botryobasidium botryosum FD-172 SS1]|uniref:Uncharacterized protein n=1 Tax=Botryobasidium botryosum (strain FD-172 SS1) TaxID=930990 RepID=A0A067LWI8_BOTB1|nr:hypothetical protein BOTBODRAFT_621709 [Botryobasidium botryosum FD-172 SS1]
MFNRYLVYRGRATPALEGCMQGHHGGPTASTIKAVEVTAAKTRSKPSSRNTTTVAGASPAQGPYSPPFPSSPSSPLPPLCPPATNGTTYATIPYMSSSSARRRLLPQARPVRRIPFRDYLRFLALHNTLNTEWIASYPAAPLTAASVSAIPAAWLAALDAATKAGLIPSIAPATLVNGAPTYSGQNSTSSEICSSTQCRGDLTLEVWDVPDGKIRRRPAPHLWPPLRLFKTK